MGFNNHKYNKYAVQRDPLAFMSMWLALEKDFIPLFKIIRSIGGESLIDAFHNLVADGKVNELNSLTDPMMLQSFVQKVSKVVMSDEQTKEMISVSRSIINIVNNAVQSPYYNEIMRIISLRGNKEKEKIIDDVLNMSDDQLSTVFADTIMNEINKNPQLITALRSGRTGMGYSAGLPHSRLVSDLIKNEAKNVITNDSVTVTNFMNLLTTLLHRYATTKTDIGDTVIGMGDVNISREQDFAFIAMCETGADPNSQEAQYDILRWIDATENTDTSDDPRRQFDTMTPGDKSKTWVKNLADFINPDGFAKYGKDYNQFLKLYNILSTERKPQKFNNSTLQQKLYDAGFDTESIEQQLYAKKVSDKKNFVDLLLAEIPEPFHNLFYTINSVSKMTDEQKELYKERYPDIARILDNAESNKDISVGQKIRTAQLTTLRQGVVQAWSGHLRNFHNRIKELLPNLDDDMFVQLMFLDDDQPVRGNIIKMSNALGLPYEYMQTIETTENYANVVEMANQIYYAAKESKLKNTLPLENYIPLLNEMKNLHDIMKSSYELMYQAGTEDLSLFKEIIAQQGQMTKLENLLGNIPPVVQMWTEPMIINGKEIIDPAYAQQITRSDVLSAAGYNPLSANRNITDVIKRKKEENIEEYKNRLASLMHSLIETGELMAGANEESPLSPAVYDRCNSSNSALHVIHKIVNRVLKEELATVSTSENVNYEDTNFEDILETEEPELNNLNFEASRIQRKQIIEDLLDREGLTVDDVGAITLNSKSIQNTIDEPFKEAGLTTDSEFSAAVINIFRNGFNLPVCSYELEVNSPNECALNKNGFKLDFAILVDKLYINSNGGAKIEPTILLAGEAFGYDKYTGRTLIVDEDRISEDPKEREKTVKRNNRMIQLYKDGIKSADGEWEIKLSDDGKQLMATYPETSKDGTRVMQNKLADWYVQYNIRSSYKEPYETFLAHTIKADTIFIGKFDPKDPKDETNAMKSIMKQLDNFSVLWRSEYGASGGVKYLREAAEAGVKLPAVAQKYIGENIIQPYSNQELYAKTLLAHFDLQEIVIPLYYANPEAFTVKGMVEYRNEYNKLQDRFSKATDISQKAQLNQLMIDLKSRYSKIINTYNRFISGEPILNNGNPDKYQDDVLARREEIQKIIDNANNMSIGEIRDAVLGGMRPLFVRKSVKNNVSYKKYPSTIYEERIAHTKWWNKI